jgi:alanine dehydrogenase
MIIGIPKEIKNHEYRVAATPDMVRALTTAGHTVWVEQDAGLAINYSNKQYNDAGAVVLNSAKEVYKAELILKVKEPIAPEYDLLQHKQKLFCFFHLAADPALAKVLLEKKIASFAYETVTNNQHRFPILAPMSEVAGKAAAFQAAYCLQAAHGGNGTLLNGAEGAQPAKVLILGAGIAGTAACKTAVGAGADVTILDINEARLRTLSQTFGDKLNTDLSTAQNIEKYATDTDALIGCVLLPGKLTPKLISKELIKKMQKGSVFIDVSIDQGGCAETSKATTHQDPTYIIDGVVHYCVANIPGAFAKTSTQALTDVTLPYIIQLANTPDITSLIQLNSHLTDGLNTYNGFVIDKVIAEDLNYEHTPLNTAIKKKDNIIETQEVI